MTPDVRPPSGSASRRMQFESPAVNFESFFDTLEQHGGIAEERIVGKDLCSPACRCA